MRYNERVQEYNTQRRQFPANVTAKMFGFKEYPYFEAPPEARQAPKVNFEKSSGRARPHRAAAVVQPPLAFLSLHLRIAAPPYELALDDIGDVQRTQTSFQRVIGLSTIHIRPRDPDGLVSSCATCDAARSWLRSSRSWRPTPARGPTPRHCARRWRGCPGRRRGKRRASQRSPWCSRP